MTHFFFQQSRDCWGNFASGPVVSNMKLGWDRGKGRWFMSGILPIGPAKKTGSISDSEIDPVCYNGILWHDNRANSRMPPSDGACRFGLPLAPIIEKGIIYFCYAILFCIFLFVLHRFSRAIGDSWRRTAREKGGSMSSGPLAEPRAGPSHFLRSPLARNRRPFRS